LSSGRDPSPSRASDHFPNDANMNDRCLYGVLEAQLAQLQLEGNKVEERNRDVGMEVKAE